jgi:hypothetical protein
MGTKNHYAIEIAFQVSLTDQPPDGLYHPMEWGMCCAEGDNGTWTQVPVTDRSDGDFGFGKVTIDIDTGDTMTFNVFSATDIGTNLGELVSVDWARFCFRPAYDVAPGSSKMKLSPFNSDRTKDLLEGIDVGPPDAAGDPYSVGIGQSFAVAYSGLLSPNLKEVPGAGDSFDYEFTAYVATTVVGPDGNEPMYFKTDPELITGKRGG